MTHPLDALLESYREAAKTNRELGTYFERLAVAYLQNDPLQTEEFERIEPFSVWAEEYGWSGRDTGIDLVGWLRHEGGYCAIQCKCYPAAHRIQKSDIDSFISASGKAPFVRRLVIETTDGRWSDNAEEMIRGQSIPVSRVSLTDLRESRIQWDRFGATGEINLAPKKTLRPFQRDALDAVKDGLVEADRGKLIMACGTGKTFTSLKIAEEMAGAGGRVLFLMPSLALMSQSVREWTNDCEIPLRSFAVCSDAQVGKRRSHQSDIAEIEAHDLAFPATTEAGKLFENANPKTPDRMTVVFSTYQSIKVISDAQKVFGLPEFDLIICDEAHRTTGATLAGEDESNFVKVHDNEFIKGLKRLYMTATPRIFGDAAKTKAGEVGAELASMDNEELYGETLFHRGFSWAVQNELLTDYKVIVLAMDEGLVSAAVQRRLGDASSELVLDDATKIIGCYKALTKTDMQEDVAADPHPMKRALAFCRDIKTSKLVKSEFSAVVDEYLAETDADDEGVLRCEIDHVDGTFNAKERNRLLDWLKADSGENVCRILTNARCLSEGVDVPALDSIMFLHPRKSQIDVVQSVGRVMRRAPGKKMGYVILPVGVPAGVAPEQALSDNERYRVVWQILNALRAHDERFDAMINKASLGQDISDKVEIIGITSESELEAVTAVVDDLPSKTKAKTAGIGTGGTGETYKTEVQTELTFTIDEFSKAILAKIVKKCGTRDYWEDWATNIAEIAKDHISRLTGLLEKPNTPARKPFDAFLEELQDDLNDSITEEDAVEMLAQHIITRPVFESLFEGHQFTKDNPVSRAIQKVMDVIDEANLDKESRELQKFYDSVKFRASGLTDPAAKQKLVVELYDKFFRNAFPRTTEKLGIVYTPVEIVDFIINSVDEILRKEFDQSLGSPGVHIMDPFTGTGTFVTRLLQSGLIKPEELENKFRNEIHANEIVLLAYYIAAINIEAVYHGIMGGDYVPFEGICLTDTFQMYESDDLISHYMPDNSERRKRQKATDIRVIVGNPPYSVGQATANDDNANIVYPSLDERIRSTYAARSANTNMRSLYDSYIRAIRWASDRIGDAGVIAFVTNAGWVDGNAADGMRACLAEEFTDLHVFHLRGNARTSGERRQKERGNVFGEGSRAPVAISIFVKNPNAVERGRISFCDIGEYLDRERKLEIVRAFGGISGIAAEEGWRRIEPNEQYDWINQREDIFSKFANITAKGGDGSGIFEKHSSGLKTNRDQWVYDFSKIELGDRIGRSINFFNNLIERHETGAPSVTLNDPQRFKWCQATQRRLEDGQRMKFHPDAIQEAMYRPFQRMWVYKHKSLNWSSYLMPRFFPDAASYNRAICLSGPGARGGFSSLMTNVVPSIHFADRDGAQCFPLYLFDRHDRGDASLFDDGKAKREGVTDAGLKHFQNAYAGETITKEDIFYYVYGLLHSKEYRERYADNLTKELPRIPCVKKAEDFWAFSSAGRALGDLHVDYEKVEPYPVTYKQGDPLTWVVNDPEKFYRVTKMKFGGKAREKDKSTVIYNTNITMENIPLDAYDYVVNGKPALEWVMERQVVKTDKASGIVNDANRYAIETMGDPAYPLKLFQLVITVSLETMKIVRSLPELDID